MSLDRDDNQAVRFLRYLAASLNAADNRIGVEACQLMAGLGQVSPEIILTSLVNDLDTHNQDIVLVLDDYHLITSQAVHAMVAFLLEHLPNNFHLIIAGRSDTPLPLSRLRGRGQVFELRAADLRFSGSEANQLLNDVMGLNLGPQAVSMLEARTEGWVAGLQLAALSMRDREDLEDYIRKFAGTNRYIMDFMLEEVLAREPEDVQAFLLRTSILNRLCGPLCDAVTGTSASQEMLERLEANNLFIVPLDDDRRWYRYQHLFADLLQARLYQSGPETPAKLLICAARWCEKVGQISDAVGYALAARDYPYTGDLLVNYWAQIANGGEIETVWTWLNALPEEFVKNNAPLSIVYCWMLYLMGRVGDIEKHLVDAGPAFLEQSQAGDASQEREGFTTQPAELAALRSFVARYHEEYEGAITLAEQALSLLPANLPTFVDMQLRTVILVALAAAYDGAGSLEKAVNAYSEAIRLSRLSTNSIGIGVIIRLVGALLVIGRLRAAESACREALKYVETQGMARLPSSGILHVAMSEVLLEQNHLEAAQQHLAQGIELGRRSGRLDALKNAAGPLSRLRQAGKDVSGALTAFDEAEFAFGGEVPPPLARVRDALPQGQGPDPGRSPSPRLLAVLNRLFTWLEKIGVRPVAGCHGSIQARCGPLRTRRMPWRNWGDPSLIAKVVAGLDLQSSCDSSAAFYRQSRAAFLAAFADLEHALILAEPEGYVRIFLDEGRPLQMLISRWFVSAAAGPIKDYAHTFSPNLIANRVSGKRKRQEPPLSRGSTDGSRQGLVEPLSPRELEVTPDDCIRKNQPGDRPAADCCPRNRKSPYSQHFPQAGCPQPHGGGCPGPAVANPALKLPSESHSFNPYSRVNPGNKPSNRPFGRCGLFHRGIY